MYKESYHRLASALDKLPNGFPRTKSDVEIEILRRIFNPEEAELASHLTRDMESISEIAHRANLEEEEAERRLSSLAQRGLLRSAVKDGKPRYRLTPWIVGILETQLESMDHSFAHLVEDYIHEDGFVEGIMKPLPLIHRVIPAQSAVKSEWILPYDDVKKVIESSKAFGVRDCICRKQKDLIGARKCEFPLDICMSFSKIERPPNKYDISKEEALALLDKAEKVGLVHTVSNVMEGLTYMCNCCICCCGILQNSSAVSNYFSTIEHDTCTGCSLCEQRCQVKAISIKDNVATVDLEKCIGCGLCVTGCSVGAARLQLKPEDKRIDPPKDFRVWEDQRLQNRGSL